MVVLAVLLAIVVIVLAVVLVRLTPRSRKQRLASAAPEGTDAPLPPKHRVWVVFNPTKPASVEEFKRTVNGVAKAMTGHEAQWIETTVEDPGTGQAIYALQFEPSVVLAAGGDGTVRAVAAGMAHAQVPMGILPAGTGNLLARNLNLPLDLPTALEVAISGKDRPVDLAWLHTERVVVPSEIPAEGALLQRANASQVRKLPEGVAEPRTDEYAYAVIAGLGFDGETMANTSPKLKKAVGWTAYVLTALKSLEIERMKATVTIYYDDDANQSEGGGRRATKSRRTRLGQAVRSRRIPERVSQVISSSQTIGASEAPGAKVHQDHHWEMSALRARTVLFANCGDLPFVKLAPDATLDDGSLDVIAIDTQAGIVGWLNLAVKVFGQALGIKAFNARHDLGQIAYRQAPRARVDTNRAFPVQVDGDPVGSARTVIARVDAGALIVRVPGNHFGSTK